MLAILGFAYLLLFPGLVLVGLLSLPGDIAAATEFTDWLLVLLWLPAIALGVLVSLRLFMVTLPPPKGLLLERDKLPALFTLLDEIRQAFGAAPLEHVILNDQYALHLVPVPRFGLPIL